MASVTRLPTWKERDNNKRRERRRRAIASKIYSGLRMYGNYRLPKHCDNNEVLKALCNEAGWTVELDGTTYRKGCKPPELIDIAGATSSSFDNPASSPYFRPNFPIAAASDADTDTNSLIPWLKNLSSISSSKPPTLRKLHVSVSAPVTPPLSTPTARTPSIKTVWDDPPHPVQPSSPPSPTFSLVSSTPFGLSGNGIWSGGSSRMWTSGQSGMCSPVNMASDVQMVESAGVAAAADEFAFGSYANGGNGNQVVVKPWEGERIHECGGDDLELTLGSSKNRG